MASFTAAKTHILPLIPAPASTRRWAPSITVSVSPLPASIRHIALSSHVIRPKSNFTSNFRVSCSSRESIPSKHSPSILRFLVSPKCIAIASVAGIIFHLATPVLSKIISLPFIGGGGGGSGYKGSGGSGSGGSGGWQGDDFWRFLSPEAVAIDDDPQQEWDSHGLPANIVVQLNRLSGFKKYKLGEIIFFDRRRGTTVDFEDFVFEMVSLRPCGIYTKAQLQKELETLSTCGLFEKVDLETKTNPNGTIDVKIPFIESTWQGADMFRCINVGLMEESKPIEMDPHMTFKEQREYLMSQQQDYIMKINASRSCLLSTPVQKEILMMLKEHGKVNPRILHKIRNRVQQWYHENGYSWATVVNFGNLNTKELVCEVAEGDITKVAIQFQDKLGNVCEGNTRLSVINRQLPSQLSSGQVLNIVAVKEALRNINSLGLFSNIEFNPRTDEQNAGGIILELKLKELESKSAEVSTEWTFVPGRGGRPTLASIQPGGTVSFEHRNIQGLNRSLLCSINTSDFLDPQDDLAFKLEYVHPYVDGIYNPRDRTFKASCFNSRKMSPVFTSGLRIEEVPPIWVDRTGLKANITENFTPQSKFTCGLVMEEIKTRDESSHISANGQRLLPNGGVTADGPPTTLSGTGIDHLVFLQANITRDNTRFVNGAIVGDRNVFQLDQGVGIGSRFPVFNRHQLTVTKFLQLLDVQGAGTPLPPVLVLHGHYGGCVGDLPNYDAFTLGGPYSVRGYNMGELGAARNILELAAELRIPVRNTHAYIFAEHGNDLGSSKDVKGNPTKVYKRVGYGSSFGIGAKLGSLRVEYAVDHNSGTGAFFFRFGERF